MVWMGVKESLVLLEPRERLDLLVPLEVLAWLAPEVCPEREVVLAPQVPLVLEVLTATLALLAPLDL